MSYATVQMPLDVFYEKGALKNFATCTRKHLCWSLLLKKLQVERPANLLKRDSNILRILRKRIKQSCGSCEIFKNIYFEQHLRIVA